MSAPASHAASKTPKKSTGLEYTLIQIPRTVNADILESFDLKALLTDSSTVDPVCRDETSSTEFWRLRRVTLDPKQHSSVVFSTGDDSKQAVTKLNRIGRVRTLLRLSKEFFADFPSVKFDSEKAKKKKKERKHIEESIASEVPKREKNSRKDRHSKSEVIEDDDVAEVIQIEDDDVKDNTAKSLKKASSNENGYTQSSGSPKKKKKRHRHGISFVDSSSESPRKKKRHRDRDESFSGNSLDVTSDVKYSPKDKKRHRRS